MRTDRYLLDTSALVALLNDEDGAARVAALLRDGENALIPSVALMEIYYLTLRQVGQPSAERRYTMLRESGAVILWDMDESTLLQAARLKAGHRLSLADALIASQAIKHGAILVHKDPEYDALAGEVMLEALPYKPGHRLG